MLRAVPPHRRPSHADERLGSADAEAVAGLVPGAGGDARHRGVGDPDLSDPSLRRWSQDRDFTTSVVAGILVLLITTLVVDRVINDRQLKARSYAIAAQSAIIMSQASRAAKAMSAALDGTGERDAASDEVRTYLTMLLTAAPVLIDAAVSRHFLERAQKLGGELARTLATSAKAAKGTVVSSLG